MKFTMDRQEMDLWCWAAVASAIDRFFDPVSARSQCNIATLVGGRTCCPRAMVCNHAESLRIVLSRIGRLDRFVERRIPLIAVHDELRQGFPVAARIEWPDGGGHFVVISGISVPAQGEGELVISDPIGDTDLIPYREFARSYRSFGVWTHTYYLRP